MQIGPYQGPWGKLHRKRRETRRLQRSNTNANKTVARRCCSLVSSTREHYLVPLLCRPFGIPISAHQNSAFQR